MKHYPSTSNNQKRRFSDNIRGLYKAAESKQNITFLDYAPLVKINDSELNKKVQDHWVNEIANISTGNSLQQHTKFLLERKSYSELAMLATDDIISNAIETITRECLSKWGKFDIVSENELIDTQEIIDFLDKRFKELDLQSKLMEATKKSLIFGGALVYFSVGGVQDLNKPLLLTQETSKNKLLDIKVVEAWHCAPNKVNLNNPLENDYMRPSHWHIQGAGEVDSSRLYPLVFFEAPNLIKPMFNFLGISLIQFMEDKVKSADTIRKALADIFLRFKTNIIRTPALMSMDSEELRQRVEMINLGINNFSTLLLSDSENFEQSITPIAGLDKIFAQAQESVASAARIPINKLFGQTPTGLNNSGAYDLASFYDTIQGYQNNTLKPFLLHIAKVVLNEKYAGQELNVDFEFNPLEKINELETAQAKNFEADFYSKLISAGIITQDSALSELQKSEYVSSDIEVSDSSDDLDLGLSGIEGDLLEVENNADLNAENGEILPKGN